MTIMHAVNSYVNDHPRKVEDAINGESMAVDAITRDVIRYLGYAEDRRNYREVQRHLLTVLDAIEEGERPLFRNTWQVMTVEEVEDYIEMMMNEVGNPSLSETMEDVLFTQWDSAYEAWILKGGNHVSDSPVDPEDSPVSYQSIE